MSRLIIILALLSPLTVFAETEISGKPKLIDGRTLDFDGQQVRLWGLDAPDMDQSCFSPKKHFPYPCGASAFEKIGKMLRDQVLVCKGDEHDEEGRLIAICYSGRIEVNEQQVLSGWAVADTRQSDRYMRMQNTAKQFRDGLWRMVFVMPWEWRAGNHEPPPAEED